MLNANPLELDAAKQAKYWSTTFSQDYKGVTTSRTLFKLARSYIGRKVLDIGAADGALIKYIQKNSPPDTEVTGVDLAPKSPEVIQADCTKLPFESGSFDTVFSSDVIEHLATADLAKFMQEAERVLRPGGHLILATLNDEDLKSQITLCPHCLESFHPWGHCQTFTADSLGKLVHGFGFQVQTTKTLNLALLAKRPFFAGLIYACGISRLYKQKLFHLDLILVARKS